MSMIKSRSRRLRWEVIREWEEAVDGAGLLNEIREVFRRYVVLPKWGPEMLALWTVHTYVWQLRDVTTYVGVSSPEKRCGKTTLLGVLGKVVHKPLASANISPPALFRVIEEAEPTLLIDEADTFLQGNDEMRGILNAGYNRETAYVVRVGNETRNCERGTQNEEHLTLTLSPERRGDRDEHLTETLSPARRGDEDGSRESRPTLREGGNGSRLQRFSCWCPKVMAAIGRLPETLADRCIVIQMQRKSAQEQCARLKDLDGTEVRSKCARFVNDYEGQIKVGRPEMPNGLNDRAADIWEPLLVLADLAGGEWPRLAREAAQGLSGGMAESNVIGLLLIHIFAEFRKRASGRMFSRDLVAELNAYGNRPWAEGLKGERIDEYWLANQLRRYGVRPKTLWVQGVAAKGYVREDFEEVFRRYITPKDVEEATGERESTNNQAPPRSRDSEARTREVPSSNDQTGAKASTRPVADSSARQRKEAAILNHQTEVTVGGQAPVSSVQEERAVRAQTKARKEDWRRIAGI